MKTPQVGRNQNAFRLVWAAILALMVIPVRSFGTGDEPPPPPPPCDPSTNCSGASYSITNLSVSPATFCLGSTATATLTAETVYGTTVIGYPGGTNGECYYMTNLVDRIILSNIWIASVGSWAETNTTVQDSWSFTPTNLGVGTVSVTRYWLDGCDAETVHNTGRSTNFLVHTVALVPAKTNVFVNMDDDNANGTNDFAEPLTASGATVANENDLVLMTIDVVEDSPDETVTLSVANAGGHVRIWGSPTRGPGEPLLDNGISTQLSTNWPIGSMPTNVWVEGVSASGGINDVSLSLSTSTGCDTSTNLTVFDVTTVSFQTNLSPLLSNTGLGGPGGGLAIFPDRPTPNDTNNYFSVRVVVTVQPASSDLELFLRTFDVDDPSSTNAPPLDDETFPPDNKALINGQGTFATGTDIITIGTGTNGVAQTNFNVTMQPGDNFRVTASLLEDFRAQCDALQTNDHGALAFVGTTNEIPSRYETEMLTVWRRLHVEVDSMAAVTNNHVSGAIRAVTGSGAAPTNLNLSVNLNTGLSPSDVSSNLSTSTNLGRFENGTIIIGTGSGLVTNAVTGNGDNFVVGNFSIPFSLTNSSGSNVVIGQVLKMFFAANMTQFNLNNTLGTNGAYNGGTLAVAGHTFTVLMSATNSVRVPPGSTLNFLLHDDDDDTVLPHLPNTSLLAEKFAPAYIVPIVDGGGNTNYIKQTVAFRASVDAKSHTALDAEFDKPGAFESETNRIPDFWVAYILAGFQPHPTNDLDPDGIELGYGGMNGGGASFNRGAMYFHEVTKDSARYRSLSVSEEAILEARLVVHEIGHQFNLIDHSGGLYDYTLLNDLSVDPGFLADHLHLIRFTRSPGQ